MDVIYSNLDLNGFNHKMWASSQSSSCSGQQIPQPRPEPLLALFPCEGAALQSPLWQHVELCLPAGSSFSSAPCLSLRCLISQMTRISPSRDSSTGFHTEQLWWGYSSSHQSSSLPSNLPDFPPISSHIRDLQGRRDALHFILMDKL